MTIIILCILELCYQFLSSLEIDKSLSQTSTLLIKLDSEQQDRLSQEPHQILSSGQYVLPNPTDSEVDTGTVQ